MSQAPHSAASAAPGRAAWLQVALTAFAAATLAATLRGALLFLARDFTLADVDGPLLRAFAGAVFGALDIALLCFGVLAAASFAMRRWPNGLRFAPMTASFYAFLVWGFATLRMPVELAFAPGVETGAGIAANVGAAVIGLALATIVLVSGLLPGTLKRSARALAGLGLVVFVLLVLARFAVPSSAASAEDARPNVLLISIDTLRPDHLGIYGHTADTSPHLDAFLASALRFESAYTNHPWTLTAHATMLTGMLPSAHGVNPDRALDPEVPTVAGVLRDAGYRTLAVVDDNDWLHSRFGYARGFERYARLDPLAPVKVAELLASFDDLAAQGGGPFFTFAHFYDVHSDWTQLPYDSEPADRERFAGWYTGDFTGCDPELGCASTLIANLNQRGTPLEGEAVQYVSDLYDAGIATLDRALGQLFKGLEARGLTENTIVIVTSDHGEEFFEHGRGLHDQHFNECLQIPFFIRMPDGRGAGVSEELVELADLAPTILELAGVDASGFDHLQGRSLVPLVNGESIAPSPGILMDPGSGAFGLRNKEFAVIRFKRRWFVFDRRVDPGELNDLFETGAIAEAEMETLRELLSARRDATQALGERYAARPSLAPPPEEVAADLESLGYVGEHQIEDDPDPEL